jgi:hypothetical protein
LRDINMTFARPLFVGDLPREGLLAHLLDAAYRIESITVYDNGCNEQLTFEYAV